MFVLGPAVIESSTNSKPWWLCCRAIYLWTEFVRNNNHEKVLYQRFRNSGGCDTPASSFLLILILWNLCFCSFIALVSLIIFFWNVSVIYVCWAFKNVAIFCHFEYSTYAIQKLQNFRKNWQKVLELYFELLSKNVES